MFPQTSHKIVDAISSLLSNKEQYSCVLLLSPVPFFVGVLVAQPKATPSSTPKRINRDSDFIFTNPDEKTAKPNYVKAGEIFTLKWKVMPTSVPIHQLYRWEFVKVPETQVTNTSLSSLTSKTWAFTNGESLQMPLQLDTTLLSLLQTNLAVPVTVYHLVWKFTTKLFRSKHLAETCQLSWSR